MAATHIVRPGETLGVIAQSYGVDIGALASANGISNAHLIHSWQELTIPSESARAATVLPTAGKHTVSYGETLATIAKAYGVSLADLRAANDLWTWLIYAGQELNIPGSGATRIAPPTAADRSASPAANDATASRIASPASAAPSQPQTHTVQRGETLFRIALRYGLAVDALLRLNDIEDPRRIHAGNVLRVSAASPAALKPAPADLNASTTAQAPAPDPTPPETPRKRYLVKRGDTLSEIGARLNMSWRAIADVNGIANPNALHAGLSLLLPNLKEMAKYSPDNPNAKNYYYGSVAAPGPKVGVGREIVIQLSTQTAYAYENGILQKRALISSGLPKTPTVQGDFQVYYKVRSQTMDGPGYYLENVEWVMYFKWEYAIHGTYWHFNFGRPMSHGCVNMTNADAKWFYEFASIGTPVSVRQ